jgi:hypothetical protein
VLSEQMSNKELVQSKKTIEDLEKSARASGVSLDQAVQNLVKTVDVAKAETEHHHA